MFKKILVLLFYWFFLGQGLTAQFAPPAGQEGSTAIPADDPQIIAWAVACEADRGLQNILMEELGLTTNGDAENVPGAADNLVISLGDGGMATVIFDHPVRNGDGWDFVVFENGFDDLFLELAFVEVSSNGTDFFRFPATSLTDTSEQTLSFGTTDATMINNLAGKYRAGFGTPFDLEELSDFAGQLDLDHITHVRVVDVIGTVDPVLGSRDASGNLINDPFPTPFPVGGFDLDAVGVIHQNVEVGLSVPDFEAAAINVFPNPVGSGERLYVDFKGGNQPTEIVLLDAAGKFCHQWEGLPTELDMQGLSPGIYYLFLANGLLGDVKKIMVK
ncbi:MAG: T9SS C-terminal target domain-containing protein [Saprospiraceae bacterium]|nr:T9SS C-terminal target domain-containing protein [Saprospiraceae bacterium]MCB9327031.1 T9SS C-terminal target domain-containing protein [Lewinellaceae bacterium]